MNGKAPAISTRILDVIIASTHHLPGLCSKQPKVPGQLFSPGQKKTRLSNIIQIKKDVQRVLEMRL
jgi:hypothetical protein